MAAGAGVAGSAAVAFQGVWREPRTLSVTEGAVPGATGARASALLAQVSDLHLKTLDDRHRRLAVEITARRPDLVLLTGDAFERAEALPLLDGFLRMLPRVPSFAVLGNWEVWSHVDRAALHQTYARHGVRLLVNETAEVRVAGRRVVVTGLDDPVGTPDVGAALRGVAPSPNHLLLAHSPGFRDALPDHAAPVVVAGRTVGEGYDAAAHRFRAMLSGHTHGGQVAFGGWAPFRPPGSGRYTAGWYTDGDGPPLYVSRGLGTSVLPIRLGCPPELAMHRMPLAEE